MKANHIIYTESIILLFFIKVKMSTADQQIDEDPSFEEIFYSLKKEGLIDKNRKLEAVDKTQPTLMMSLTKRNTIMYRRDWREIWDLDKNAIRFTLLHEEAHLTEQKFQGGLLAALVPITLYFLLLFMGAHIHNIFIDLAFRSCCLAGSLLILSIILIFVFLKLSVLLGLKMIQPWAKKNEINCDLYAAKKLRYHFGLKKPSKAAKKVFKPLDYQPPSLLNQIKTLFFTIRLPYSLNKLVSPHPPWKKRIEIIKKVMDE